MHVCQTLTVLSYHPTVIQRFEEDNTPPPPCVEGSGQWNSSFQPLHFLLSFIFFDCTGAPAACGALPDQPWLFSDPPTATHSLTVYMTRPSSAWTLTLWPADDIDLQVQFTVLVPRWQLVNPQQPAASLSPQMAQRAPNPPPRRESQNQNLYFLWNSWLCRKSHVCWTIKNTEIRSF